MTAVSLMTLPSEIRLLIWKHCLPTEIEFVVPGCYETGESGDWKYIRLPSSPRLPLMLINKHVKREIATLPPIVLVARIHDWIHLDEWLDKSTLRDRSLVSRVRVDIQCIRGIVSEKLSRRAESAEWYVRDTLGESLVRYYEHVEPLKWELTMKLSDGWLDVIFKVAEARKEKLLGTVGCHRYKVNMRNGARAQWTETDQKHARGNPTGTFVMVKCRQE